MSRKKKTVEEILRDIIEDPNSAQDNKFQAAIVLAGLTRDRRRVRADKDHIKLKRKVVEEANRLPTVIPQQRPPLGETVRETLREFAKQEQEDEGNRES